MVDGTMNTAVVAPSRVISVVSPKGGVGKTMIATNLAVIMSRTSPTVLLDMNSYSGDVEQTLKLHPVYRMDDLALQVSIGSGVDLDAVMTSRSDGLHAVCAPKDPYLADKMDTATAIDLVDHILELKRSTIFDTAPGVLPFTISSLDRSSCVILVCGTDNASVRGAGVLLDLMDKLGLARELVHLVINRPMPKTGLNIDDVRRVLALDPTCVIPDEPSIAMSMNRGVPIVDMLPHSTTAKLFGSLAASVSIGSTNSTQTKGTP